ncbi:sugar efflux transporter SetB, MFS transporter|nr:sugar efflux transporter SetB, MFS transporter [Candidatus Pantoea persica]
MIQGTLSERFGHIAVYWLALAIAAFAMSARVKNV